MAEAGAEPFGIDSSPAMIAQARQNFPRLKFQLIDAAHFETDQPFDAAFSNAALHWMLDPDTVTRSIARALQPGARFVAEMGGKGNIAAIDSAIHTNIHNYFPSISEYSTVLERHGFEVEYMALFDRPTPLEGGESGLSEWIAQFRPDNTRSVAEVESELRPQLFHDGQWHADYRRLRFIAKRCK